MKFEVKVMPRAKQNLIKKDGDSYRVYLTAPAVDGKANTALIDFLAEYFSVRKNQVAIIKGLKSRNKVINIYT